MSDDSPNQPTADALDLLRWVRRELVSLCEATEDDSALCRLAQSDTETKQGAFARGRIHEAKGIRRAMAEVIHEKIREVSGT